MTTKKKTIPNVPVVSGALERERLVSLINSMADGVLATDENAKLVMYNGQALNILDRNNAKEGDDLHELLPIVDKDNKPIDIDRLIREAKIAYTSRDFRLPYADGSLSNLYISIAPVRLGYGQAGQKGYVVLLRDITREKSLEEERDEFISVVSHELRTPIAIAEGNLSNARFVVEKDPNSNPAIVDALKQAYDQVQFLSGMINDLATLSRAERNKLSVEVEPINVHDLIDDLQHNYAPEAKKKGLEVRTEIDPHLELLYTSKLYAREILQNFITNSIKYTEKGHIIIGAKLRKNGVEFFVQDTGIGISKGDQGRVFDKFFRSEDYRTKASPGTGLGLYVTAKLAHLVKAEISLESELNVGSVFTIFIPNLPVSKEATA
jgi:two-component system phosphate regulon sensor histidine kinase PhoR